MSLFTSHQGVYRGALISTDQDRDNWTWTIRLYKDNSNALKLFKQGQAGNSSMAEHLMMVEINNFLDGDGT